jgi:hypothetical protein
MIAFGIQQEMFEREFPTPHEWSWISRMDLRSSKFDAAAADKGGIVDWARSWADFTDILKRLEDPNIDGAGLVEQDDGGIFVDGIGKTGYDISNKPEPWRRGYYEVLMGCARAAEYLDDCVRDVKRNLAFPKNTVIGPSNPNPRPVAPGSKPAPLEEDCAPGSDPPEMYYMRILTTHGFTEKQRLDAALAYAAWLDYKQAPEAAGEMYKWALDIAASSTPNADSIFDKTNHTIKPTASPVSDNILAATTALAVHNARTNNLSTALPIFLSVLRARRSLPPAPPLPAPAEPETPLSRVVSTIKYAFLPPAFPPPPPDGTVPPTRTPSELCKEAALMTHIGEILYATSTTATAREQGLAWTREAVDIAEEELRRRNVKSDPTAEKTCRECLKTGLGNWGKMVAKLAREEKERKVNAPPAKAGGWLGFGGTAVEEVGSRWEAEESVVKERMRRAKDVLGGNMSRDDEGGFMIFK